MSSQRLSFNDSMKLACSIEATSLEQLEEHIFPKVIEPCKINVIQQALFLSHRTSNIREVICEVTSVDCIYLNVQIFLLFLLRKTRRRDQTEFSLSKQHVRVSVWALIVPSEPCIHLDMKIKPNVQIEGGQTAVYVIYAISVLERKDPTECDFCEWLVIGRIQRSQAGEKTFGDDSFESNIAVTLEYWDIRIKIGM